MTEPIIIAEQISKSYGRKQAIDHLSLTIEKGSVTGILGGNGAGKSTFFRMITGLVRPDSGRLTVLGEEPGWRTNSQIAYLPDRARWYGNYTAEQTFDWGSNILPGFEKSEALRLAELMNLPLDLKTEGMSKGQEARLMLILCIARSVPLIVLDEPFSGIDGSSRERIIEALIDAISEKEQTLLISTHEIYEVEGLMDDVVFLKDGAVQLTGNAEKLRTEYGSIYDLSKKMGD
ncbi:ABC transporter ATP-binding protein [Sporolactobacillus shoreae]|uniref:ABC transporter ATP-binding protein n=1 Tax=Sporolactobacillus shoreae TaxID=1465501 RepID=A0A4Z0GNN4_9BACL|nr:ABC transporter ATP-binding protein [Sporolactobacillus shoreae]TGA97975.1 ABC transporter ATP-binding protein [Sporolactobacillus shoreae]